MAGALRRRRPVLYPGRARSLVVTNFSSASRLLLSVRVMHRRIRRSRPAILSLASHVANPDQPAARNRAGLALLARVDRS